MARIRLVPLDDTSETANKIERIVRAHFPVMQVEKVSSALWYLHLGNYDWMPQDATLFNQLAHEEDLLAGWNYLE